MQPLLCTHTSSAAATVKSAIKLFSHVACQRTRNVNYFCFSFHFIFILFFFCIASLQRWPHSDMATLSLIRQKSTLLAVPQFVVSSLNDRRLPIEFNLIGPGKQSLKVRAPNVVVLALAPFRVLPASTFGV